MRYLIAALLTAVLLFGCGEDSDPEFYVKFNMVSESCCWTEGVTNVEYGGNVPYAIDNSNSMIIIGLKKGANKDEFFSKDYRIAIWCDYVTNAFGAVTGISNSSFQIKMEKFIYTNTSCNMTIDAKGGPGEAVTGTFSGVVTSANLTDIVTDGSFRIRIREW